MLEATVATGPRGAALPGPSLWATDEVSSSSFGKTSSASQENEEATPAVDVNADKAAPLQSNDTIQPNIRKMWADHFSFRRIRNQFRLQSVDKVHIQQNSFRSCTIRTTGRFRNTGVPPCAKQCFRFFSALSHC